MSTLIEQKLWQYPSVYITEDQLDQILGGTSDSRNAHIQRAMKKGLLIRLKRGLYYLGERLATRRPSTFEVAQLLYGPSYLSLESALSYHGLIPERVYTTTSVTIRRNNTIETPLGIFTYNKLPVENFFTSVERVKEDERTFLLASPWKALLDYIYCYKKQWRNVEPLQESLRIELEDLPKISQQELEQLDHFYKRKNVHDFIKHLPKEFIHVD